MKYDKPRVIERAVYSPRIDDEVCYFILNSVKLELLAGILRLNTVVYLPVLVAVDEKKTIPKTCVSTIIRSGILTTRCPVERKYIQEITRWWFKTSGEYHIDFLVEIP